MFAIPKAILKSLDLAPNTQVGLSVSDGRLIIDPYPRPRFTLAELMAQYDTLALMTEEDRAWLKAEPEGREEI